MNGQSAQYMFFTARMMVFSAAKAVEVAKTLTAMAAEASSLLTGILRSSVEEQGCEKIESERGNDKEACENEPGLNKPVRQRARASIALSARELGGSIYQPVAIADAAYGHCEEVGLIRCEPGKIANPGPAHAETEQNERQNAAGRGGEGSGKASGCHQPLLALQIRSSSVLVDRHGHKMHPVATTGSRTFLCVQSQLREPNAYPLARFRGSAA